MTDRQSTRARSPALLRWGVLLAFALAFLGPAIFQANEADHRGEVEGIAWSRFGFVAVTDHSVSTLGSGGNVTQGTLQSWNGDPNRYSTVRDHTPNGVNDRQVIYANSGQPGQYVANETFDTNGTAFGCGHELLDHSRSGHQVQSIRGGTISNH